MATLAVLIVLVGASVALVLTQRNVLTAELDESLSARLDDVEALVASGGTSPVLSVGGDEDTVVQVVDQQGRVLASTANVEGQPPIADPPQAGRRQARHTVDGLPHDGASFRVASRSVEGPGGPMVIHIAGTTDDIAESTRVLAASLLVITPVVAALLAVLVWWLVGRTLRPVEAIRAEVAAIGGADLDRRVPVPPGDDEISDLARTMNGMLERVSTTVDRQRRFVADASHELRSPLTRIRSELEVDLAHPEVADPRATHRSVLEETIGLQRLVDDLLLLARSDANVPAPTVDEPVDLDDIVVRVARRAREEAPVAVEVSEVRALRTRGDARQLTRAVANLADNAVRHATSRITLTLARQGDLAVLAVADDGPGIPVEQWDRVFDRFTRVDEARPRATGGTGLGLAIAREIVEHHGGTLTIDGEHRPGACFVVALPIDRDDR